DGIGSIIVLIFFASLFINIYEASNIGVVLTAFASNIISSLTFTGIWLILIVLLIITVVNLVCPNSVLKWSILSATVVPLFMNASISPEFSQIVFNASDSITNGITPLFLFFVIYLAFMEKYNKNDTVTLFGSVKYMMPYSIVIFSIFVVVIVAWYLIGIPIGIGSFPGVIYGS
ncbi:MAG: hypothetical protein GX758_03785, partial [Tenericutes bacterium]|nr:hypothetical protein [Mycoplasmatota bacterium]